MEMDSKLRTVHGMVRIGYVIAALAIVVPALATTTYAQDTVRVKIDFGFVAAGKDMPAATYEFRSAQGNVVVRASDGKASSVMMPVITRLGRHDADADPELVFDKVEGKFILSEVWMPNQDGYLLASNGKDHEHRVVGGSRPRK